MNRLYTIGYEGAEISAFVNTLKSAGIHILLDVREIPISRRRGFSKNALKSALTSNGIEYRHEKQLGSPKPIRHRLRQDGDYHTFFRDFEHHLAQQSDLLERLRTELVGNVALMCYERDPSTCHRTLVATAFGTRINRKPTHLGVNGHDTREARNQTHSDLGEGFSTA